MGVDVWVRVCEWVYVCEWVCGCVCERCVSGYVCVNVCEWMCESV